MPDSPAEPGAQRPLVYLLGLSFQELLRTFMDRLAAAGYPDLRPIHGLTLRVLERSGATSVELAAQLGVTKQAAGQLVEYLQLRGYVERQSHPLGGRRRLVVLSPRGRRHLDVADEIMRGVEAEWTASLDGERQRELRGTLEELVRATSRNGVLPPLRPVW
ncbi:MAG: MarR family winged helix-turn-helix transcriptional regulator [Candidatus Velthaea sp.]